MGNIDLDKNPKQTSLMINVCKSIKKVAELKEWWMDMGRETFNRIKFYFELQSSVEKDGWAHFDYINARLSRGIFLAPAEKAVKLTLVITRVKMLCNKSLAITVTH